MTLFQIILFYLNPMLMYTIDVIHSMCPNIVNIKYTYYYLILFSVTWYIAQNK